MNSISEKKYIGDDCVGHFAIVCLYGEDLVLHGESTYKVKDASTVKYAYTVKDA